MKFNETLDKIKTYEAGKPIELVVKEFGIKKDEIIKLASNENPYGAGKKAIKAIKKGAKFASLYPDDSMSELKAALAKKYELELKNIIIGQGSDEIIEFCVHAKANRHKGILTAGVTFAMYEIYAKQIGAKVFKTESKEHDLDEFLQIYKEKKEEIAIIFLCIPNNPLGECVRTKELYDFLDKIDDETLVVIDGAYNEFASYKDKNRALCPKELISKYPNTIYLGTFSKLYGLGGMRIGYALSKEEIISTLMKVRAPFNVTTLSLIAATAALEDKKQSKKTLKNNLKEMKRYEEFAIKKGLKFTDSYTNFITFYHKNSSNICNELLKKGVILRDLKSYGLDAFRITIGTKSQNDRVLGLLDELL